MRADDHEDDGYEEAAISYAVGVLTYMQNGGKLSDIDATASEILRLNGRELKARVPGALKATVLMDAVEDMTRRHNHTAADAVFRDMMAQARIAGRIRTRVRENVESFKDIAADIVTAHENGTCIRGANPAADHVVDVIKRYGKWPVLAAAALIRQDPEDFPDIPADKVEEFMDDSYLLAGATVRTALEAYAKAESESGTGSGLARLYDRLDKAGGVDRFDWGSYADDGMLPTEGLHFVVLPVPAGESGTYIFGS